MALHLSSEQRNRFPEDVGEVLRGELVLKVLRKCACGDLALDVQPAVQNALGEGRKLVLTTLASPHVLYRVVAKVSALASTLRQQGIPQGDAALGQPHRNRRSKLDKLLQHQLALLLSKLLEIIDHQQSTRRYQFFPAQESDRLQPQDAFKPDM